MVDEARVLRLLRALTDDLAQLEAEAASSTERQADPLWSAGVKYLFVTSIEACVDVAQHVCASEGWGPPADNGSAIILLARHGVLGEGLGRRMRLAVGFRNVLVHDYVEVDDDRVRSHLDELGDLRGFATAVARWLPVPEDGSSSEEPDGRGDASG